MNECFQRVVFLSRVALVHRGVDSTPRQPDLFVLSPLQPEGVTKEQLADEVCLATGFRPKDGEMRVNVKKRSISMNTTNAVMSQKLKSYVYAGFTNQTIYSCELNTTSSNNDIYDLCADLYPDKAKLNFYLLVMNSVRVVFTKALAFSTILTIRAVLF
ncbi:hypothetical protein GBF38_015838 [Nibea albiflora]|uniref:Uncharacterized protein n=1 Tax=Nibea albiflora TaxID=240163 RepID=A0ACB7FHI6_NIBAL|nr:hypothetical protein GBF38_015838 [Nibea albiflora]